MDIILLINCWNELILNVNLFVIIFISNIDDSITNLSGFNIDLIVEATIRCLEIIQPDIEISKIVPTNMAARFRLGGNLAQACLVTEIL